MINFGYYLSYCSQDIKSLNLWLQIFKFAKGVTTVFLWKVSLVQDIAKSQNEADMWIDNKFVLLLHGMNFIIHCFSSHPKRNENTLALHAGKYSHIQAHSSIIEIQHTIMGACLCATFAMHLSSTSNSFKDIIAFILKRGKLD